MNYGHGFVWPAGLPNCATCGSAASDTVHVTPMNGRLLAAVRHEQGLPRRAHPYMLPGVGTLDGILCLACAAPLRDRRHVAGMPSGHLRAAAAEAQPVRESAFVAEISDKIVFASRGLTGADLLPSQIASRMEKHSKSGSANMWITGRFVEADRPNRNAAYWSTADLEVGQPTVAHGPINWLHEEKHVIGAIADSELVYADRQAAADGSIGNHIVMLGAIWPWVGPEEARMVRAASESNSLWVSMECISRSVACLDEGCGHEMGYADYMREKASRCEHMQGGHPRRFVDPIFEGAGIIVPPVRPGWARADARVLMPRASALAERQAAAFDGMESIEAELLVAQLIASAEE